MELFLDTVNITAVIIMLTFFTCFALIYYLVLVFYYITNNQTLVNAKLKM